jgi:hypothetical protein
MPSEPAMEEDTSQSLFIEDLINHPMVQTFTYRQKMELRNLLEVRSSLALWID